MSDEARQSIHADEGPVERPVRPLYEEVRDLAYARAGGHTSDEDGRYDPELLYVMCTAADALERAEQALRGLLAAGEGLAQQQAMREAYDAGLQEGFNAQLVAAALEVVRHMNGRMPVRGWLNDNDNSRKALDELAKVLGA